MVDIRDRCYLSDRGLTALLLVALALVASCGCLEGEDNPETVGVTGNVTYNGSPVTSGEVRFNPVNESGRIAVGKINPDGSFQASTFEPGDGVIPGEYRLTVISYVIDENTPQKDRDLGIGSEPAVPQKYFSAEKSGLEETFTEPRSLTLKLVD